MNKVTILRKWNNPLISINITLDEIAIEMTLDDFVFAMADEVAEPLVKELAQVAGNPTFLFTRAQLEKMLVSAIEGPKAHAHFVAAAQRIVTAVKGETVKAV